MIVDLFILFWENPMNYVDLRFSRKTMFFSVQHSFHFDFLLLVQNIVFLEKLQIYIVHTLVGFSLLFIMRKIYIF
jgi:hypothetical protein